MYCRPCAVPMVMCNCYALQWLLNRLSKSRMNILTALSVSTRDGSRVSRGGGYLLLTSTLPPSLCSPHDIAANVENYAKIRVTCRVTCGFALRGCRKRNAQCYYYFNFFIFIFTHRFLSYHSILLPGVSDHITRSP